jgi:plastocyanin
MRRLKGAAAGAVLLLALAGCGRGAGSASGASPWPDRDGPAVAASDLMFDRSEIRAPADEPFALAFDNRDGAPHKVAIYTDDSVRQALFVGDIFGGPATRSYHVPALPTGTYFFRCDLHPEMKGDLIASPTRPTEAHVTVTPAG